MRLAPGSVCCVLVVHCFPDIIAPRDRQRETEREREREIVLRLAEGKEILGKMEDAQINQVGSFSSFQ